MYRWVAVELLTPDPKAKGMVNAQPGNGEGGRCKKNILYICTSISNKHSHKYYLSILDLCKNKIHDKRNVIVYFQQTIFVLVILSFKFKF